MRTLTKENLISVLEQNKNFVASEDIRKKAMEYISENDFPNKKDEIWTNFKFSKIAKHQFSLPKEDEISEDIVNEFNIVNLKADKIVFVNGFYSEKLSEISEKSKIEILQIEDAKTEKKELFNQYFESTNLYSDNLFSAINTAYATNGNFIYIPDNYIADNAIHIINFIDGNNIKLINQSRNLIIVGKNSEAKIINSYHSLSTNFTLTNTACEIFLNENSKLDYFIFQGEGDDAFHINNTRIVQKRYSNFTSNTATLCGSIVKNNLIVDFADENCETNLNGLYLPDREQYFDNYLLVNHAKANCTSSQLYKGIIDNKAEATFFGKVYVAPDAQKTLANQSNKNLLLTDYAKAHSKPQLEIYADDVSCSHGSTTGQLDKEALFYLRTRGLSPRIAKNLLMHAFVTDAINTISLEPYRNYINFLVNKRLNGEKIEGMCAIKICPSC